MTKAYITVTVTEKKVPSIVTIIEVLYARITMFRRWDSMKVNVSRVKSRGSSEKPLRVIVDSEEKAEEKARTRGYKHMTENSKMKT
jgi:hypothetical protein